MQGTGCSSHLHEGHPPMDSGPGVPPHVMLFQVLLLYPSPSLSAFRVLA